MSSWSMATRPMPTPGWPSGRFSLAALNPSDTAKQAAARGGDRRQAEARRAAAATGDARRRAQHRRRGPRGHRPGARRRSIPTAGPRHWPRRSTIRRFPADLRVADRLRDHASRSRRASYLDNLREVMKRAPSRLQTTMAETLAGDAAGADALLALVESGHASPRLLAAAQRQEQARHARRHERSTSGSPPLTAKLPPASETLDKLIARAARRVRQGDAQPGKAGRPSSRSTAPPAIRSPARAPSSARSSTASAAAASIGSSRTCSIPTATSMWPSARRRSALDDGQRPVRPLPPRRRRAARLRRQRKARNSPSPRARSSQQQKTALSLMPANVPEIVPADEFNDLVGWLLSQRAKPAP